MQEKVSSEETSGPTTDDTSHSSDASQDTHAHTENKVNKDPEILEKTAGTTTGSHLSSGQRSSETTQE